MSVDTSWNIESYRTAYESEEHWELKREFMEAHKDRIPEARLICLAQVFVNIELLGCKYPDPVMKQVAVLARDVGKAYKESKKNKLQRTFVKASDAAGARLKGTTTSSLIEAASTYGTASPMSLGGSNPMSMTQGGGNPMASMNAGAGNFMSSMNAGGGSSMSSMNTGSGNFKSSINSGANNPMSSMNAGGSNPMNRGCNPMSSTNPGIANPTGSANTMSQGSSNASSLLGRPPSTLASKLAALKKPVAFVTAGTSNPLTENNNSGSDTTKTPNPNTPMLGGQNSNNNKNSSSLLGSPPQYNSNSGYMFGGQSFSNSSTFRGSNANPSVFGGLSANPNMFGGSNPSSSLTGGSNSSAATYGGSNNNPSMTGGIKSSLYGGLINSTPSDNTGGSNTNSSMLGGSNTNRPMLGGGSSSNSSMLGGSNTMLGSSNSTLGGSNSGTSLLGSGPNTSASCLFPGGPPSPPTTIITAPPNKKKKSKADKNKDKPITEKFIKFIGGNRNAEGTPEVTNKSAMTPPQKANASEVEGHQNMSSSSSSFSSTGFSSASSNFSSSKMSSQMSSSSSFKNPGPSSSSSAFSSSSFSSSSSSSSRQPTQPQPQPIMRQTSQQQSHLAHWCNVVGRNNPLLAFVLVRHENHDNNGAAAAILNTSSCFSRIPINYGYNKVVNLFECTVNINGVDVVSARSTSRKKAREQAVVEAIAELPKHCFTLRVKKNMLAESVTLDQVANDLASRSLGSQDSPLGTNSVANKMMKQMGWTGGGLGKKGEGITEPIRPSEVFGRQGLGLTETSSNVKGAVTPAFRKRVRDIISDYASNARNVNLAFSNEFSKDQRTEIHKIARLCHLKSVSHGSGKTRCVVISRKIAAQDLLLRLLQEGSNDQYQLIPPTSYQP